MQIGPGIFIENQDWQGLKSFLLDSDYSSVFVLSDSNTQNECLPILNEVLESISLSYHSINMPAGEGNKNLETAQALWSELTLKGADRTTLFINLGGGVVTDLGAFVASTFKRGIDFIHIPTSLLAMVDASIGGKAGIDFNNLKNQIGLFSPPKGIFIFPEFLNTLDIDEFNSGKAELIKHALIYDSTLFDQILTLPTNSKQEWTDKLKRAIEIKVELVESDPKELGDRKKLNFGHTLGHAVETHFLDQSREIKHGFAIAAGMIMEAYLSKQKTLISLEQFKLVKEFLQRQYSKLEINENELDQILGYLKHDKKNEAGELRFSLLNGVGSSVVNQHIESDEAKDALLYYFSL